MRERHIIHLNVTDFAVAVERLCDTSLKGIPVIVAPEHAPRGLVYDMSEEAYQEGVRKGMDVSAARRYCRGAHVLTPRISLYRKAMTALGKQAGHYSPLVERGMADGHLFLDVTGTHRLFGPPPDIAWRLRKQVVKGLGLDPAWSLASNKLVAKVASRMVRPHGEYIVGAGDEHSFLAPLPLSLLPGLKPVERKILHEFNLVSIGDLSRLSRQQLLVPFQKRGAYLYQASRGRDLTPVLPGKSSSIPRIVREHVFAEDTQKYRKLKRLLTGFVHEVGSHLRQKKMLGRRIAISLTHSDGRNSTRQATHKPGTDNDFLLRSLALTALDRAWTRRIRIRSCMLVCDRLLPRSPQQTLFVMCSDRELQQQKIVAALDAVRDRFGKESLRLGLSS